MENTLIDKGREQLRHLRTFADELEVQMALGKAEARDAFVREKKNVSKFLNKQKKQFQKESKITEDKKHDLLVLFEKLEESLNLEVPTAKRKYDLYKKDVLADIYALEYEVKETYGDHSVSLQRELDEFKDKMDVFRINLAINDVKDQEKVAELKSSLHDKVTEIRSKLQRGENEMNKFDNFVEDISESFNYFKRAVTDLID